MSELLSLYALSSAPSVIILLYYSVLSTLIPASDSLALSFDIFHPNCYKRPDTLIQEIAIY